MTLTPEQREERYQLMLERNRQWKINNPDRVKELREHDKERNRQRLNLSHIRSQLNTRAIRGTVIRLYGSKCARCGVNDWRVLDIDHVNNDGNEERKYMKGDKLTRKLSRLEIPDPSYQLLCANCNRIKEFERQGYMSPTDDLDRYKEEKRQYAEFRKIAPRLTRSEREDERKRRHEESLVAEAARRISPAYLETQRQRSREWRLQNPEKYQAMLDKAKLKRANMDPIDLDELDL